MSRGGWEHGCTDAERDVVRAYVRREWLTAQDEVRRLLSKRGNAHAFSSTREPTSGIGAVQQVWMGPGTVLVPGPVQCIPAEGVPASGYASRSLARIHWPSSVVMTVCPSLAVAQAKSWRSLLSRSTLL